MALDRHCDNKIDCLDHSDEGCSLLMPLPRTYQRERPHRELTELNVTVTQLDVIEVDVDNNLWKVKIEVGSVGGLAWLRGFGC